MESLTDELKDQVRGVTGALLVAGLTFHYTMETWWLGWTLPLSHLVTYALVGLGLVVVLTRSVGFHRRERRTGTSRDSPRAVAVDFAEITLQSFFASYVTLVLLGVLTFGGDLSIAVRLGLVEVVPLGFGAALANRLFRGAEEGRAGDEETFPKNIALFTIGAVFVSSTIAPTQEMELITAHMGWVQHALLVATSLVMVYIILYELDFQGQEIRLKGDWRLQVGETFTVYAVGATVSFLLLAAFGHFGDANVSVMYQETVALSFPASLGAAAAPVVI